MKRSVARKFRFGRSLLAGMLLAIMGSSIPVSGIAQVPHGGGHASDFGHHGERHGFSSGHQGGRDGFRRGHHGKHHGSRIGRHGGVHRFNHGHVIVLDDPGIIHRGPLGFELHNRLRRGHALRRAGYAATSGYYPECRTVYMETHVQGWPATVSGLMCYDEYGSPYVIPESRRLVEYYD
jgi:hypothetical protein